MIWVCVGTGGGAEEEEAGGGKGQGLRVPDVPMYLSFPKARSFFSRKSTLGQPVVGAVGGLVVWGFEPWVLVHRNPTSKAFEGGCSLARLETARAQGQSAVQVHRVGSLQRAASDVFLSLFRAGNCDTESEHTRTHTHIVCVYPRLWPGVGHGG